MSQDDIERDISNPKKKKDRNFLNYGTARKIDRCNVFLSGEEGRFKRFFFLRFHVRVFLFTLFAKWFVHTAFCLFTTALCTRTYILQVTGGIT